MIALIETLFICHDDNKKKYTEIYDFAGGV